MDLPLTNRLPIVSERPSGAPVPGDDRERLRRLEHLTQALGDLLGEAQVAREVLEHGLPALGAATGSIVRLVPGTAELETIGAAGFPVQALAAYQRFPLEWPTAHGHAVRTGQLVCLGSREEAEKFMYPREPAPGVQAVLSVPLQAGGRAFGAMGVTFPKPRAFSPAEREFALTVGRICAQAMERAQTFEREHQARQAAEAAQARLELVAAASQALLRTLDQDQACAQLVQLVIGSGICDLAAVDLLENGELRRVALEACEPALAEMLRRRTGSEPRMSRESHPVVMAIRAGAPQVAATLRSELWDTLFADEEWRETVRALDLRSYVVVPLFGRSEPMGALKLMTSSRAGRTLGPQDLVLAQELAARAGAALENARLYAQAREAIGLRDEFLSIAGHELRTPLTALKLQLQSALRRLDEPVASSPQEVRVAERTEKAVKQVERLSALVDRLLDVSRITAGRFALEPEPLDLGELAREACGRFAEELIAAGSALAFYAEEGVRGTWDRLRLEQLLANLLSNAVKYGAGRPLEVRVRRESGRARLTVRDHGPGIASADQARLFERFERLSASRRVGGLGLGLWISRRIAEAHFGTLTLRSEPGAGAEFVLELPL